MVAQVLAAGLRRLGEGRISDAVVVGLAQALALIPGISRSGMTITEAKEVCLLPLASNGDILTRR